MSDFLDPHLAAILATWAPPVLWLGLGVCAGMVVEWVALARLKAWSERSGWGYDSILVGGLKGVAFFWCLMLGIFLGSKSLDLPGQWQPTLAKALVVALMFSLTVAVARVAGGLLAHSGRRSGGAVATSIIANLASVLIWILGFLVILDSIGVQITPVLTALGVGGLAVALALQDTLGNLFAGLQLVASKKINTGDLVRLDSGDEGIVADLTWRYTSIHTLAGNLVIIPNAKLSAAIVTNYTLPAPDQPVAVAVGVAYGSDLELVERTALAAATEVQAATAGAVPGFQPVVRFAAFTEGSVTCNVVLRAVRFQDQFLLRHELIKRLHAGLSAAGIAMPMAVRTLHVTGGAPAAS
jgi:small-conductance mechanosensitive channel